MAGPTSKVLLLCGVCLVKQMSAGLERCRHSREESALQKEKDQNQIVLFSTRRMTFRSRTSREIDAAVPVLFAFASACLMPTSEISSSFTRQPHCASQIE